MVASLIDTVEEAKAAPVVPARPPQTTYNESNKNQEHVSQPVPSPVLPPTSRASPTPAQGQCQAQSLLGHGFHRHYLGKLVTDGISTAKGVVHNIAGYLHPQNPTEPREASPMSPFEMVDQPSLNMDGQTTTNTPTGDDTTTNMPDGSGQTATSNYPQLYPNLVQDSSNPCSQKLLLAFGKFGAGIHNFLKPYGLAAGKMGEIIVSDKRGNRLFVFSSAGELLSCFSIDCGVLGVTVTHDNNLMIAVTQSQSAIMRLYTMNGRLLQVFGDFYKYDLPSGISITPNNYVIISNIAENNILVFTDQRKFSVKFGRKGKGNDHFTQPKFVTSTSKDYIVVSDSGNDCIKIFDITGNFKRTFGRTGESHGCLSHPLGIATDSEDNIIVADSNNFRVEIFTAKGMFYTTFLEKTNLIGPDVKPINVCVTPDNSIAVLLNGTGFAEVRVYKWRHGQNIGGRFQV